jgi:hypothetical protein
LRKTTRLRSFLVSILLGVVLIALLNGLVVYAAVSSQGQARQKDSLRLIAMIVSPQECYVGEEVSISIVARNLSPQEACTRTITLSGDAVAGRTVTLAPKEYQAIIFNVVPTEAKVYHVYCEHLSGSFTADTVPEPAVVPEADTEPVADPSDADTLPEESVDSNTTPEPSSPAEGDADQTDSETYDSNTLPEPPPDPITEPELPADDGTQLDPAVISNPMSIAKTTTGVAGSVLSDCSDQLGGVFGFVYVSGGQRHVMLISGTSQRTALIPPDAYMSINWATNLRMAVAGQDSFWLFGGSLGDLAAREYTFSSSSGLVLSRIERFGNRSSLAGDIVRLTNGNVVVAWHQLTEVGVPVPINIACIGPSGYNTVTVYNERATPYVKAELGQHPDGSVWLFTSHDGSSLINATKIIESNGMLTVAMYAREWIFNNREDPSVSPEAEHPTLKAFVSADEMYLCFQNRQYTYFNSYPLIKGSHLAFISVRDRQVAWICPGEIERTSSYVSGYSDRLWAAFAPYNAAIGNFTSELWIFWETGEKEMLCHLTLNDNPQKPRNFAGSGNMVAATARDGKMYLFRIGA